MSGCDRCGHRRREHNIQGREPGNRLCSAPIGPRLCLCPKYLKTGAFR